MPLLGSGIVPTGALGSELTAVTRRAFVPKLIVQNLYKATPILAASLALFLVGTLVREYLGIRIA